MAKQKFKVGDKVLERKDDSGEVHKVVSYTCDGKEITYRVTSRELDVVTKTVVQGISHFKENELELYKSTNGNKTK